MKKVIHVDPNICRYKTYPEMIATKHGKCCKEIKVEVYSQRQLDMLIKKTGKKKKLKRCNLNSLEIHLTSTTANITYQEKELL